MRYNHRLCNHSLPVPIDYKGKTGSKRESEDGHNKWKTQRVGKEVDDKGRISGRTRKKEDQGKSSKDQEKERRTNNW